MKTVCMQEDYTVNTSLEDNNDINVETNGTRT